MKQPIVRLKPALKIEKAGRTGTVDLVPGVQSVGGDPSCDIVILGFEARQYLSIELDTGSDGVTATVEVLSPGVQVRARQASVGDLVSIKDGDHILINGVRLSVSGLSGRTRRSGPDRRIAAAILLLCAFGLLVFAILNPSGDRPASERQQTGSAVAPVNVTMKELRDAFRMSGLKLDVQLDSVAAELVIGDATTELNISEKEKLASIINVFAKRSALPLADRTKLTSGLDGLIAATALEPVKFVVGTDGIRYREGEILAQKWKIESIEPGSVKLTRDGKQDVVITSPFSDPLVLRLADRGNGMRPAP